MIADGHEVKIATKHHHGGQVIAEGVEVFDGTERDLVSLIAETENYDYIISCMDTWVLSSPFRRWVAVNLLDAEFIHPKMIESLRGSQYQIAITEHGKRELERAGFKPFYAPLGVDTKLFRPDVELRREFRQKRGWAGNTFVIGLVGINYSTDRKNIIGTLRAFQGFNKRHPNSILYLHTDMLGSATQGLPLKWVTEACGFDGDGKGAVRFVDQKNYHLWNIAQEELVGLYNAFDVMCLPSAGEGFGLPWLEAQACGCPVIAADTTSGKQLCLSGWLIPQHEDDYRFSTMLTWYVVVPPSQIDKYLEKAYRAWEKGEIEKYRARAREKALAYDWDTVYAKYWRPILETLAKKGVVINTLPNYGTRLYEAFTGRILMIDCKLPCGHPEICDIKYPLLPGEWEEAGRGILARSYPVVPDKNGSLLVTTACPLHRWLSPRFISECKNAWGELSTYPVIRREIARLWDEGHFNSWGSLQKLDDIECDFDEGYKQVMQAYYRTTFKLTDDILALVPANGKVLDVGTGDGARVEQLRERGFDALGTEVNEAWVNGDTTIFGDAEDLPFGDDSFDLVLCVDVLEHLKNPLVAVKELLRVSRGKVVIQITPVEDGTYYEDPTHCVPWTLEQWKRELVELCNIEKVLSGCGFVLEKGGFKGE
jgi:glycosyltransferase involved in cell wall biosynthesis/2-polyprenyl-3-methyl-5-hydroxy-6-metoxy-1,4-benzoquinol methylase